jgi:hypothetical protein
MKICFSISLLLLSVFAAFSQHPARKISPDSIAVWELRKVAHPLGLDSAQRINFLGITKNHLAELDNIKKLYPNDSSKTAALKESQKGYRMMLKAILTKKQYESYKLLQEETRNAFIKKQDKRKIKVKPLEVVE